MQNFYQSSPWLESYPEWLPKAIEPVRSSVLQDFENACRETPDAPALYYFDNVFSYRQLRKMALGLRTGLDQYEIGPGSRILIILQNIPQAIIALLAAFMNRSVVVPLNPMYKTDELVRYIDDSGATLVICQDNLYENQVKRALAGKQNIRVITTSPLDCLDQDTSVPEQLKGETKRTFDETVDFFSLISENENVQTDYDMPALDDLAYLVYTSGTTGPPKGAMIAHSNVAYGACLYKTCCRVDRNDVILGVAPFFHVTGISGHIALSFHARAPLVIFHRFDLGDMLRLMEKYQVSFTVAAITVYTAMMNYPKLHAFDLSAFKKAISGGAPVSEGTVEKMKSVLGFYIHNVYGMTETSAPVTFVPLGMKSPVDAKSGALSVGLTAPEHQIRIVDLKDANLDVSPGEEGELAVKGPLVVSGYWNKPEETANAIRNGWMLTGDIASMDHAGWCYIIDRKKDLINSSGYKVWPRDVEDVLYKHPGVMEAVVVGVPDDYRGETVKAFVKLEHDYKETLKPEDLIAFCKEKMAAYKYPRIVEFMDELPKTATGKFLRRALKE